MKIRGKNSRSDGLPATYEELQSNTGEINMHGKLANAHVLLKVFAISLSIRRTEIVNASRSCHQSRTRHLEASC